MAWTDVAGQGEIVVGLEGTVGFAFCLLGDVGKGGECWCRTTVRRRCGGLVST
jgi:hypothetical protein